MVYGFVRQKGIDARPQTGRFGFLIRARKVLLEDLCVSGQNGADDMG
jgi:hypothetical protein